MESLSAPNVMARARTLERAWRTLSEALPHLEDLAAFPLDAVRGAHYASQAAALRPLLLLEALTPAQRHELRALRDAWALSACRATMADETEARRRAARWACAAEDLLSTLPSAPANPLELIHRSIAHLRAAQPEALRLGLVEVRCRLIPDIGIGLTVADEKMAELAAADLRAAPGAQDFDWIGGGAMGTLDDVSIGIYWRGPVGGGR